MNFMKARASLKAAERAGSMDGRAMDSEATWVQHEDIRNSYHFVRRLGIGGCGEVKLAVKKPSVTALRHLTAGQQMASRRAAAAARARGGRGSPAGGRPAVDVFRFQAAHRAVTRREQCVLPRPPGSLTGACRAVSSLPRSGCGPR